MVSAKRRRRPGKPRELEDIRAEENSPEMQDAPYPVGAVLQHRKWQVIHKLLRDAPFQVSGTLPRAEQWRRVAEHIKKTLDEPEIIDWAILQKDVAANRAAGIQDLRPRKDGPCYDLLMEFVRDRKRKALAVVRWTRGEGGPKRPSFSAKRPPLDTSER